MIITTKMTIMTIGLMKMPMQMATITFYYLLREAFSYLWKKTFTRLDFYLMFLTRFLFLAVGSGILAHWKTFSFTQSIDDNLVSIAGGEKECNVFLNKCCCC